MSTDSLRARILPEGPDSSADRIPPTRRAVGHSTRAPAVTQDATAAAEATTATAAAATAAAAAAAAADGSGG